MCMRVSGFARAAQDMKDLLLKPSETVTLNSEEHGMRFVLWVRSDETAMPAAKACEAAML